MNPNAVEVVSWDTDDHGTWSAYIGWNGLALFVLAETAGSALVLDDADQGLLNSAVLGPTPDGWVDLGCYLSGLVFRRGATDDAGILTRYEAGQATLTFDNTGLEFEPDAPAWQINLGTTIVILGRDRDAIDLIAADPSENPWDWVFGLFKGTIDDWQTFGYEDEARQAVWQLVDDVPRLQAYNGLELAPVGAGDTTEERINRCLALANWSTRTGSFSGTTFDTVVFPLPGVANPTHQETTLAQPVWEMILRAADAGQRSVFISGTGLVVATPIVPTLATSWDSYQWGCDEGDLPIVAADWEFSKRQLVNTVDAAKTGGSEITVQDATSVARHKGEYRTGRNDLTLENDVDVEAWAGTVVQWAAEPSPRVTRMRVSPSLWNDNDLNIVVYAERFQLVDLEGPHTVALVVGNSGSLTTGDTLLQSLLDGQFDTVTVFDDSTAEGSITAGTYDLIVIADSVTPATVTTKWKSFTNSVIVLDSALWDDQGLTSSAAPAPLDTSEFGVPDPEHDLLSLSTGTYRMTPDSSLVVVGLAEHEGGGDIVTGDAQIVALWGSAESSFATAWVFEDGDTLSDSTTAAGRRAALGMTEASLADPSAEWLQLFQELAAWLVPSVYVQQVTSTPGSQNAWQAILEFSDWVGSSWIGENTGMRHYINAPIPGTSRTLNDVVTLRGVEWRLDADVVDIEFVTSTIAQFLDQFILNDNVYGILDAGHRVS